MENFNDLKEKMRDVPFGNSKFQILHFIAQEETPERVYRNCLLQLNQKIKSLKECSFRRRRREIEVKEIKSKINTVSGLEKERLQVDLDEAQFYLDEEVKLIEDCMIEIKTYEKIIESLPSYSREDFEKSERVYWERKLLSDAVQDLKLRGTIDKGILKSLEKLGISIKRSNGKIVFYGNLLCKDEFNLISDSI